MPHICFNAAEVPDGGPVLSCFLPACGWSHSGIYYVPLNDDRVLYFRILVGRVVCHLLGLSVYCLKHCSAYSVHRCSAAVPLHSCIMLFHSLPIS